jgi:hypothetical protein
MEQRAHFAGGFVKREKRTRDWLHPKRHSPKVMRDVFCSSVVVHWFQRGIPQRALNPSAKNQTSTPTTTKKKERKKRALPVEPIRTETQTFHITLQEILKWKERCLAAWNILPATHVKFILQFPPERSRAQATVCFAKDEYWWTTPDPTSWSTYDYS